MFLKSHKKYNIYLYLVYCIYEVHGIAKRPPQLFPSFYECFFQTLGDRLRSNPDKYLVDFPDQGMKRVQRDRYDCEEQNDCYFTQDSNFKS